MYGIPRILQTRADYERCHALALAVAADPAAMRRHWQGLKNGARHYVFDRHLDAEQAPDGPAPDYLVIEPAEEGEPRRQMKLVDDPSARMHALGYDLAQIDQKIAQLEAI